MLQQLREGDSIRQSWLRRLVDQVNANTKALKQFQGMLQGDPLNFEGMGMHNPLGGGGGSMPTSLTWSESTRGFATALITDSTGNTHSVQIATSITMTASSGGASYSWVFTYASG